MRMNGWVIEPKSFIDSKNGRQIWKGIRILDPSGEEAGYPKRVEEVDRAMIDAGDQLEEMDSNAGGESIVSEEID
jgi:hypothetical protein